MFWGRTWFLRLTGIVGAGVFLTFFSFTFSVPGWMEEFAAGYIEAEAQERIDQTIDGLKPPESESTIGRLAQSMYAQNEARIEELKSDLKNNVHVLWANAIAAVRDVDCECRNKYVELFEQGWQASISMLQAANDRIVDFIHAEYMQVVNNLKRDIRIFTGTNAAAFMLLVLISFLKPQAVTHLFLPGTLLAVSTLICSYFYVFEQNWLLTIIHGDYLGFAYLGWLAAVFALLSDIAFNKGRITTEIINTVLSAIGSAGSVLPC